MGPWLRHLATRPIIPDILTVRAFGYRMGVFDALDLWVQRLICKHEEMRFTAATTAAPSTGYNLEVGVVARCNNCRRTWCGDVSAGISAELREKVLP